MLIWPSVILSGQVLVLLFVLLAIFVPQRSSLVLLLFFHLCLYLLISSLCSLFLFSPLFSQSFSNTLLSLLASGIPWDDVLVHVFPTWLRVALFPTCPMMLSGRCRRLSGNLFQTSIISEKLHINKKAQGKTRA